MITLNADRTAAALPWTALVDALGAGFAQGCEMPPRHHHDFEVPGEDTATLLLMPAWLPGRYMGLKQASFIPGNGGRGRPVISAVYLLSSAVTGELLALIDGAVLTNRRTAAASALAARYLAREDASHLMVVGTGGLARALIDAHRAVRPIERVTIWGRDAAKAGRLAEEAREAGLGAQATGDREAAARTAHIITCATPSPEPLIEGGWLAPGAHLDLVGAFRPTLRESDDAVMRRARIFVDTEGALSEAGDLALPLADGVIGRGDIRADLYDLTRRRHPGRESADEITCFKSVGTALEDLYAAILAYEAVAKTP